MTAPSRNYLRYLRAPLWLFELATGAKSFADNPIIGSSALNRRGLHIARTQLAHRMAWSRRRRLAGAVPAQWREAFDRDGFVEIRDFLPVEDFERLRNAALATPFDARAQQQGDTVTRRVAVGQPLLRALPGLRDFLTAHRLQSLLAYAASTRSAPIWYLQTVATQIDASPPDPQLELHADTFHPSLKVWLFLTDVTDDEAPLTYVPGSHRLTAARLAWERERSVNIHRLDRLSQRGSLRIAPEELGALGLPQPRRFAVPANTLIVVDTCGFHARGSSTRPTIRAELWGYVRRTPFLPWAGFDPLSWGSLATSRAYRLQQLTDFLDRAGIRRQHWPPVGRKRASEL